MSELARAAAKVLARRDPALEPPSANARSNAIEAMHRAMQARVARRRRLRIGGAVVGALAAAAAVALGLGLAAPSPSTLHASSPRLVPAPAEVTATRADEGVTIERSGVAPRPLTAQSPVAAGERVLAPRGAHALLGFSTGVGLALDGADLKVLDASATEKVELREGSVTANVTPLAPGRRFVVEAPDASVEVDARGGGFRIDVAPAGACGRTRVTVSDGAVIVRGATGEQRVVAGGSWAPTCAPAGRAAVRDAGAAGVPGVVVAPSASYDASTLTAQNDLFADAMNAKRHGDSASAVAALDELLSRYPGGPLSESAEVERFRLVRATDPTRAAELARSYLRRYPKGFAREEASAVAGP
jgi:hypothetical protein